MPSFDQRVLKAVAMIPRGRLATYGQIAELIGAYGCARQVGWALRRLPLPSPVPWHRVVNARGQVSLSPSREGSDWIQRQLLIAEGIPVDGEGRLELSRFRWRVESLPVPHDGEIPPLPMAARSPATPSDVASATSPPGLEARHAAWQVLQAVAAGAYADAALERELQRSQLEGADRGLATELAYGAIRQRGLLDGWLDAVGRVPAQRQPPRLRWLLHLGIYQLLFTERVPAAAAVSTTVELAKRTELARLAPVVNGMLREVLRRRGTAAAAADADALPWRGLELPPDPVAALALRSSLPSWLAELLLQWLPPDQLESFTAAANQPPGLDLRVNRLRTSRDDLLAAFSQAGVAARAIADLDAGVSLGSSRGELHRLPGFREGQWCVQDRSAQRIAPLLAVEPGQWVLDACAAPGGKSTQLAELMGDQGCIWAVDRSDARLERLRRNAARLGLSSISTLAADARLLAADQPDWLGRFDRILVDAPCSGLGTLARHPDARWRIRPEAIIGLTELQRQLLEGLIPLLKPDGRLVYATCTVHPAENSELIESFLEKHPQLELLRARQSWPGPAGDGFFDAVIEPRRG
ncbi:MAG: 16S rRNA (cytosine(967)-C(5))-methyltransferase [Cyanobacteriota bacterium]|nr:16S rRNA (cytosine(967)-C(5))-methyltransferase [Cyanobacteriota bacterium]